MTYYWKKIKYFLSLFAPLVASFIVSISWNWYHIPFSQKEKIIYQTISYTILILLFFLLTKKIITAILRKKTTLPFWSNILPTYLDRLFLVFSLLFLVFFSNNELVSLIYFGLIISILCLTLESVFKYHPQADIFKNINRLIFVWVLFLFIFNSVCQYFAFKYYILDPGAKYYNVSLFRSLAMTALWLGLYSISYLIFLKIQKKTRYLFVIFLATLFALFIFLWSVNIGILYYSGLNLSPTAIFHAEGSSKIFYNYITYILLSFFFATLTFFILLKKKIIKAHKKFPSRYWQLYHYAIILISIASLLTLASFRTTPEFFIIKSFYNFLSGQKTQIILNPIIKEKLKRFGINYEYENFYLAHKDKLENGTTVFLPQELKDKKPNIIIIFLESFSARLTSVYNPEQLPGITTGLEMMAQNPNTTIFKKYFNASTPTVTGLMSQLCSILPPTGHNEIEKEGRLRSHRLLCLPEILKKNGWQYTNYITAVNKDFAHKDSIFKSMGADEVYGTKELYEIVKAEPLSWGFSDHQLFPAMEKIISAKNEPYLAMLSTVDTHPPFTLAKDMVYYEDGKNNLLNSIYTTDHAFKTFWEEFIKKPQAQNTIVVAVADHPVFPGAITKDRFPDVADKINYYDETTFMIYIPGNILPKNIDVYSSGIDFTPTILNILNIDTANAFEGHSILNERKKYPNILGMHELGLYINEEYKGTRKTEYSTPEMISCQEKDFSTDPNSPLNLCEFLNFYQWKRQAFEEGRFWEKNNK